MRQELEDRAEQYMNGVFEQREYATSRAKTLTAIRRLAHRHVINARRADKMTAVFKDASSIAHAHGMRGPDCPVINAQTIRARKAADIGRVCRWASRLAYGDYQAALIESPDPEGIETEWSEITGTTGGIRDQTGSAS